MKVHVYSVKAKSQAGYIMSQRYNDNTERPKLKENQLGILEVYTFCRKFSRGPQVQDRVLLGLRIYL